MRALREEKAPLWLVVLTVLAPVAVVAAQWYAFAYSPAAEDYAHSQKIMYVHVPAAWNAFLAFFIVFWSSVVYLWKRTARSDLLAASAAEIGALFTGLTLVLRLDLGEMGLGRVVDLGRPTHVHRGAVHHLRGLPFAALLHGGSGAAGDVERREWGSSGR